MPLLSKTVLDAGLALPPLARFPVYRAGLLLQQSTPEICSLLDLVGDNYLPWWMWPTSGVTLIAAGGRYKRASEDPTIQTLLSWLLGRLMEVSKEREVKVYPVVPM